jgi:serine/threonine protein kinase/WD40 repeat protein
MNSTSSTSESSLPEILQRFEDELVEAPDPQPVLERYLALHPELAEKLREIAEAIELLQVTPIHHAPEVESGQAEPASPSRFGPYQVVRSIGRGGMGEVYEAMEEPLGRRVAVKTIRRSQTTSGNLLLRFDRERRTLARLHHTNIVPIFATGRKGDLLYFAMPYLSGASLGQVIKTARSHESAGNGLASSSFEDLLKEAQSRSQSALEPPITGAAAEPTAAEPGSAGAPTPPARGPRASGTQLLSPAYLRTAVQVMAAAAEGVHHAHQAGVIHRDLKPTNIMVETGGHAWVLDFGLAALKETTGDGAASAPIAWSIDRATSEPDVSLTAGPLGTLPYMAPEQHSDGKQADVRSDVWGLGVTLYELLTLHRAFSTGEAALSADPVAPRRLNPCLDVDLEAVVLKALRKDPAHRYPDAQNLADDLRHWLASEPVNARKAHTLRRLALWSRRNKGWATAVLIAGLATLGLGIGGVALGKKIAAVAKAETEMAIAKQQQAAADAQHARTLQTEAEQRERLRQRDVQFQEIQQIWIMPHRDAWRKSIERRIVEARGLGGDVRSLQTHAIAALRELDAQAAKDLPYPASNLAFDLQGRRLYSSWFQNQAIRVWDGERDETRTLEIKGDGPFAFRPDGTPWQLARLGNDDRILFLQDLANEKVIRRLESPRQDRRHVSESAITPSGSHAAALWHASAPLVGMDPPENAPPVLIVVWDATTGAVLRTIDFDSSALSLALAPDGRMLAAGDGHGNVTVWTLPDGALHATLSAGDNRIQCLAFGREPRVSFHQKPDAPQWQVAAGDGGGTVTLFDLQHKRIRNIGRASCNDFKALAFRPDGALLVSVGRGAAFLWDVATGRTVLTAGGGNTELSVTFAPDGRRMAVGCWGVHGDVDHVKVLDLRDGRSMQSLLGLESMVARHVFSNDGRLVAALANDWRVGIWERASGRLLHIFAIPPGLFSDNVGLAFDPTARRIAFSAHEHATLWDVQTGRLIQSWDLPPGLQEQLAFHGPDELTLIRCETRDRAPPFNMSHPKDHPRVYRLYSLLGPTPRRPIKEIPNHDWHCNGILMPDDGRFVIADGLSTRDSRQTRSITAYDGRSGATLWSMPSQRGFGDDGDTFKLSPSGKILFLYHRNQSRTTWLKLPGREWMAETETRIPLLSPDDRRWFAMVSNHVTGRLEWHYYPDGGTGPEIAFAELGDTASGLVFAPDSRHVAWGGSKYDVVVCDLVELQRAMAEYGLGW